MLCSLHSGDMITQRYIGIFCTKVGAEDVQCEEDDEEEQQFLFICDIQELKAVTEGLKSANLSVVSSTFEYIPKMTVALKEETYHKALLFVDLLREHRDVIKVHENFELQDDPS